MARTLQSSSGKVTLPLGVLVAGATLSIGLGLASQQEIERSARIRFDAAAINLARKVEDRFDAYTEVLIGLRALLHTSEQVTRSQFRRYVAALNLPTHSPGFQVLNYAPAVTAAQKETFEASMREPGAQNPFVITPPGERAQYHPLAFIEPAAGNEAALGKDLGAAPAALAALNEARDTGGLTSSGRKIGIKGRETDVGLAMRLPVYRTDMPVETVEQRRAAYLGSVGAGFRVADMMRGVASGDAQTALRVRLFDAGRRSDGPEVRIEARPIALPEVAEDGLLFDSARMPSAEPQGAASGDAAPAMRVFERTLAFELGGHAWVVQVRADANQVIGRLDRVLPWMIFVCGLAISALLAGIVYSLTTSRGRAQALATAMTAHLRTSERRLEEAQHLASLGSWILDRETGVLHCSDEAGRMLGFDAGAAPSDLATLLSRVHADDRAALQAQIDTVACSHPRSEFEHRLCLPDGGERWVHAIVQLTEEAGKTVLRGTMRDDTERQKAVRRLMLEHEIARLLVSDGDSACVVSQAIEAACAHLQWDCGLLWSIGADGLARCSSAWHGGNDDALEEFVQLTRPLVYRPDEGEFGRARVSGHPVHFDTAANEDAASRAALALRAGLTVGLVVPAAFGSGASTLEFFSRLPRTADALSLDSLRSIALQIAQYMQRKDAEGALRYVASHDALTGLCNRAALQRELQRAITRSKRHDRRFGVMFIDLDRFKQINDTLGHGVGDAMIKACGQRLIGVLREEDVVARFGGDEFVLLLEDLAEPADAVRVAEKVLACCAEPFVIDARELHVSASIGVSMYPDDGADAEALLKNADTAMYQAKGKGRGMYQFYAAQMNEKGTERLMLESNLRRAMERGELSLHYQPRLNLRTQTIAGVEALMRWQHPVLGNVSPAQFIPIAEESGLIEAMGRWAIARACADARAWQRAGLPPIQMSVNLSSRQLDSPTLIDDIAAELAASGLEPSLLELEITESAMMTNPEHAAALLQQIRDLGVSLAIDDFGTGYSSLSYLRRFPLTTVKIDRSFINDLSQGRDAQALTDSIITLAHGLNMKVVAEGVESAEQVAHLRIRACDEIQGYWLCRPVPADELSAFMWRRLHEPTLAEPLAA